MLHPLLDAHYIEHSSMKLILCKFTIAFCFARPRHSSQTMCTNCRSTEFAAACARGVAARTLAAVGASRIDTARRRVARVAVRIAGALVLVLAIIAQRVRRQRHCVLALRSPEAGGTLAAVGARQVHTKRALRAAVHSQCTFVQICETQQTSIRM